MLPCEGTFTQLGGTFKGREAGFVGGRVRIGVHHGTLAHPQAPRPLRLKVPPNASPLGAEVGATGGSGESEAP